MVESTLVVLIDVGFRRIIEMPLPSNKFPQEVVLANRSGNLFLLPGTLPVDHYFLSITLRDDNDQQTLTMK